MQYSKRIRQLQDTGAAGSGVKNKSIKSYMRRKREPNIQVKCDYCGEQTETFVATPNHLLFCRIQTVGKPPEKDCMSDYYRSKSNYGKKMKKKSKVTNKPRATSKKISKKEKEKVIKKFDDYLFELKQKSRRQRASN